MADLIGTPLSLSERIGGGGGGGDPSIAAEVIEARGTYQSLGHRLNAMSEEIDRIKVTLEILDSIKALGEQNATDIVRLKELTEGIQDIDDVRRRLTDLETAVAAIKAADIGYTNPLLPGITDLGTALDEIIANGTGGGESGVPVLIEKSGSYQISASGSIDFEIDAEHEKVDLRIVKSDATGKIKVELYEDVGRTTPMYASNSEQFVYDITMIPMSNKSGDTKIYGRLYNAEVTPSSTSLSLRFTSLK